MFTVKNIVILAMMLSLLTVSKLIAVAVPALPHNLGEIFVLFEVFVILFSFTLGFTRTIIVGAIFYGIVAWLYVPFFMGGILVVKGVQHISGSFFLDYVIPFICLASSGIFYRKFQRRFVAIISVTVSVFLSYLSIVLSGIIIWSSYGNIPWEGWSWPTYSFAANAIRASIVMVSGNIFIITTVNRLKILVKEKVGENYARY